MLSTNLFLHGTTLRMEETQRADLLVVVTEMKSFPLKKKAKYKINLSLY